jgi:hypothetical protein
LSGGCSGSRYSLYDDGDLHPITLNIRDDCFYGYDYLSSTHFSGRVQGNLLNLYDCENGSSFAFRMES